jgi:hypothetical protein
VFVWAALVALLATGVGSVGMRRPSPITTSAATVLPEPEPAG